ncbi:hypothetical protein ElyMa_000532200, partial [Elysia marginata]
RSNSAVSCSAEQLKCKTAYDSADSSTNKCQNARQWRKCLEGLMANCKVLFPYQLNKAEATYCYAMCPGCPDRDATDDTDAAGAHLSCDDRMERCRTKSLSFHTSNRCDQAWKWRRCLDDLRSECHVNYPRDLNQLQAVHCYKPKGKGKSKTGAKPSKPKAPAKKPQAPPKKPQAPPKKPQPADDCATKERNCKPANAKTCDDARKWRNCLDTIKDECGMKVYTRELNVLQAMSCYG